MTIVERSAKLSMEAEGQYLDPTGGKGYRPTASEAKTIVRGWQKAFKKEVRKKV